MWLDEAYFRQITAERLVSEIYRGRPRRSWKLSGTREGHLLDCRVYAKSLAEHLGLSSLTDDEWKGLIRERGAPPSDALPLWAARVTPPEITGCAGPGPVSTLVAGQRRRQLCG